MCSPKTHAPWPEGTVVVVLRSARILVAEAVGDSLCLRADQGTIPALLFENRNPRPTVPQKHNSTDMDSARHMNDAVQMCVPGSYLLAGLDVSQCV